MRVPRTSRRRSRTATRPAHRLGLCAVPEVSLPPNERPCTKRAFGCRCSLHVQSREHILLSMMHPEIILPFLKWAGGKRWLTQHPVFEIPSFRGRYIEPFLGSGSIFFWLRPKRALLSDANPELIESYKTIRDAPQSVLRHLKRHASQHNKEYYYHVRDEFQARSSAGRVARFLYLNRACWNGLYRVNLHGQFNVPKGTKSKILLDTDNFNLTAAALRKAKIVCSDFESIVGMAGPNDFIYADPPYTTSHNVNGFIKYNETLFSWTDQLRLRDALLSARDRGAKILVSNADHRCVVDLYKGCGTTQKIKRYSVISGQSHGRGNTTELLICL